MVITVEIYKQIRKMRLNGMSQRQIAATLHISRNTVKKYWDGDSVPWDRKDYSREASVLTEDVVAFVRRCLDEDAQFKSRKQHHTAKRIYDRLVAEYGFTGGETTVRRLVKELREKNQEAFVPLIFPAGDALQIDWGEATAYLDGVKTTVYLFCARLCYSGAPWFWHIADRTRRVFWMRWFRYSSTSAVSPNGLSLTTARLPSRMDSAPMPGSRRVTPLWPLTTALKRCSVIRHLATKRAWQKA